MNTTTEKFAYNTHETHQEEKKHNSLFTSFPAAPDGKAPERMSFAVDEDPEKTRRLRSPRSENYLRIFDLIDIVSSTDEEIIEKLRSELPSEFAEMTDEELLEEIHLSFVEEFEYLQIGGETVLNGVLANCYITGCDCHLITAEGDILRHFKRDEPLPENIAPGRNILKKYGEKCKCVEVYSDCCRAVMTDSSVVTVRDGLW